MDAAQEQAQETLQLLARVRAGDQRALDQLLARHREALRRFLEARLDARLFPRLDASDVIQETHLEVVRRLDDFLRREPMPFHVWLRKTAYENLVRLRRRHLDAECRRADRDVPLPDRSSLLLAQQLARLDAAHDRLVQDERVARVRQALAEMDDIDREILLLRAVDGLPNKEAALILGLEEKTASKRYTRALLRLQKSLAAEDQP